MWWKCATLTACGKQQHGPLVTDGGHEGHVGVLREVAAVAVWGQLWYPRGQGSKTWCRFTVIIVNCDHEVELDTLAVAMSYYPRSTVLIVVKMVNSLAI